MYSREKKENIKDFFDFLNTDFLTLEEQENIKIYENDWNNIMQIFLFNMKNYVYTLSQIHKKNAENYVSRKTILQYIYIVLFGINAILASVAENQYFKESNNRLSILHLFLVVNTSIISAFNLLSNFLNYEELIHKHSKVSIELDKLGRYILTNLYMEINKRPNCQTVVEKVNTTLSQVLADAPIPDNKLVKKFQLYNADMYISPSNNINIYNGAIDLNRVHTY